MTENLVFRKIVPSDFEKLNPLFWELFQVDLDAAYWEWKYEQNPCGKTLCFVAESEDRIVGEANAIPVELQYGAETLTASQTCDIAFLPDFRKGAPSLKAIRELMLEHVSRDICICYGFSVPVTEKISTSLFNYDTVCSVKKWILILNPAEFLREKLKVPVLARAAGYVMDLLIRLRLYRHRISLHARIEEVDRFDDRFDDFWKERKRDYEIMVARNSTYLNWRYFDNPSQDYKVYACVAKDRIRGYIILTTTYFEYALRGLVMDIMFDPEDEGILDCLMAAAIDHFRSLKAMNVSFWLPEGHPLGKSLKKWAFVPRDTHHKLIIRIFDEDRFDEADRFLNSDNWYFTMGDSDYH